MKLGNKVAIQGIKASFHEIAAFKFFGRDISTVMCDTFWELFNTLERKTSDYGVVAIENTVAGSILPNYALLRDSEVSVIGEVYLRIQQNLLALPNQKIEEITEVHSHPMAILQCQEFFEKYYPHIKLQESVDTALSAFEIREKNLKGIGAIASLQASETYNLEVLAEGIETNKRNYTRFLVIQNNENLLPKETVPNKASICFNLADKKGSLASILTKLINFDINLTKIQSLPLIGYEWEYFFHLDLEFGEYANYKNAMESISKETNELNVLGEYNRGMKYL